MLKFAVMASGGGTDFQSLIDAAQSGQINAEICCLVAGKPDIYAIERAKTAGIPVEVVQKKSFGTVEAFDEAILAALKAHAADFVVLAGYLSIIGKKTISAYRNKIINIHPSLIPVSYTHLDVYKRQGWKCPLYADAKRRTVCGGAGHPAGRSATCNRHHKRHHREIYPQEPRRE